MTSKPPYHMPKSWISICTVLENFVEHAEITGLAQKSAITKFHAAKAPAITISDYVNRIHAYSRCSESCLILALIYIDRVIQKNVQITLCRLNIHR